VLFVAVVMKDNLKSNKSWEGHVRSMPGEQTGFSHTN
jgi:hypothetical protein